MVLDLEHVDFMDLHGLAVLMRATRQARADGGSFAIARPAFVRAPARASSCTPRARSAILPDGAEPLAAA